MSDIDEIDKKYAVGLKRNICSNCHLGYYKEHHQWPKQYKKCNLCGFIISYKEFDSIGFEDSHKNDEEKD